MEGIEINQPWEMYSSREGRWVRVTVAKKQDGRAVLRYEGTLEFTVADIEDMRNRPELFRPTISERA
jgi:hypothetical protein